MDVIDELITHCEAWEPWARVMGNVCAGDAAQALRNLCAELETEESRRHEVMRERNALRAELAELRKPDCRTCWHFDEHAFICTRATRIAICRTGEGYQRADPVRLYEKEGE